MLFDEKPEDWTAPIVNSDSDISTSTYHEWMSVFIDAYEKEYESKTTTILQTFGMN